jgi:hypothetical protein
MIYSQDLLYDRIVLLLKRQFYKIMYTFTTCCGGSLYGPANRQDTCKSWKMVLHREPGCMKNSTFSKADIKILKTVGAP